MDFLKIDLFEKILQLFKSQRAKYITLKLFEFPDTVMFATFDEITQFAKKT